MEICMYLFGTWLFLSSVSGRESTKIENVQLIDMEDAEILNSSKLSSDEKPHWINKEEYMIPKLHEKRQFGGNSQAAYLQTTGVQKGRKLYSGKEDKLKDCEELNTTLHSKKHCTTYSGCLVECDEDYTFPDSITRLIFICSDDRQWRAEGTEYTTVPECQPEEKEESEEKGCELYIPTPNSRVNCPTDNYCEMKCHKGYKLPGGKKQLDLTCEDGEWIAPETDDEKVPLCEPEGTVCKDDPPMPPHTAVHCISDRICEAVCEDGYNFPSGNLRVAVQCMAGMWTVQAHGEDGITGCLRELLTCNGLPPNKIENATIECDDESCTATCQDGHKFPSGDPSITIICKKNKWQVAGISWDTVPDCVPELKTNTKCNGSQYLVFPNLGAYKVNSTQSSWDNAQKTCIHEGAHLAVIDSKEELELMKKLIASHHLPGGWTYAHVGFSDIAKKGVWVTVLGTKLDSIHYAKWARYNPSKRDERCGAIDHLGRLHDIFCSNQEIFICEKM